MPAVDEIGSGSYLVLTPCKGGLDNYLLFTKSSKIDSEAGLQLRDVLKRAWEQKHGNKFDRRALLYSERVKAHASANTSATNTGAQQ